MVGRATEQAERALREAQEAYVRFDVDAVVAHLSAAIRGFTAADAKCQAAMACVRLGDVFANAMGNLTAARAWFARAERLVQDEPPCVEQGWVAVASIGCDVDDPDRLLAAAELALDRARTFGDVNLETKALADGGLAHVQAGRIADGMALLDEAMALACGPADDVDATGKSVCSFFTACYYALDFERAGSWTELLRRHGLIGLGRGAPVFLSSHCDSVHATLLLELGRWSEAEAVLTRARSAFEQAMGMPSWHPDIALADLRIRQGRLAEAEVLLLGKDQSMQALLPAARLHLARGDAELAAAAARRGLRGMAGADRLRAIELLGVVVDSELARGDVEAAAAACADLTERAGEVELGALRARAAIACARVDAAAGRLAEAITRLERITDRLDPAELPWLRAMLLLELARFRERAGDAPAARLDADAAAAALAPLDVTLSALDVATLQRLCPKTEPSPARAAALARDRKWWLVSADGTSVRLADSKGLAYLALLVARPGAEQHVLDLVDRVEGVDVAGGVDRRSLRDAGEVLDARARRDYRRRIEQLRTEADDALAAGQLETAESRQAELDQLVAELGRAFGLGGRDRRAAAAAERARLNVTRALRSAIAKVHDALPGAGAVLDRRIRTGLYCCYEPDGGDEIRWIVQSAVNETVRR